MTYPVEVLDEVRRVDIPQLLEIDPRLGRAIAEIVRDLHFDPWLGAEMRERMRLEILSNCRKVSFDVAGRRRKPRFRLVYRNSPSDGSVAVVTVIAAGQRSQLEAYRRAATRIGQRERGDRGGR